MSLADRRLSDGAGARRPGLPKAEAKRRRHVADTVTDRAWILRSGRLRELALGSVITGA